MTLRIVTRVFGSGVNPCLLITALVTPMLTPTPSSAQSPAATVRVAELVEASGDVEIRRAAGAAWTPIRTGQELIGTDEVRTYTLAFARIKFEGGLQWVLRAASHLQLRTAGTGSSNTIQVRLESGKAVATWTPDRRPATGPADQAARPVTRAIVETPSGQASILGTEWSISVDEDGRTALVVLEGSVELSNAIDSITVHANEAAEMRVGQPPILLRTINPRDRVQWVADYSARPLRFADASMGSARDDLALAAADAAAGRTTAAIERLERAAALGTAPAGLVLALTDLLIAAGELPRARQHAERGMTQHPADARFDALLSRIALFEDRTAESRALAEQATAKDPKAIEGWLALGESAHGDGDGPIARQAFQQATSVNPDDARGWFGIGSVETEYEAFGPARQWLTRALAIDPLGPGYRGEMGMVETLANRLGAATREFAQALADRPGDYVAMTGRALLALKEGREREALDLLLRATLIEPNYARAQVYLGVTYHRMRRHDDAVRALHKASRLDPKDPLPYLMESAIHTDLYQPSKAMAAARTARDLMPNLKSLNQLANTQKGTANLGNSVAFFGMESWAEHLAQESYYPFWAGSHLFLGDRYSSPYARASEYYQGLLADPTVFGSSPTFQTLLPRAGHYQSVEVSAGKDSSKLQRNEARASANGYTNTKFPIAYSVSGIGGSWRSAPAAPKERHAPGNIAAAIGIAPSSRWGLFAAGSTSRDRLRFPIGNSAALWSGTGARFDTGVNLRPSPVSSVAIKVGVGTGESDTPLPDVLSRLNLSARESDVQARYMSLISGRYEISAGVNIASATERFDVGVAPDNFLRFSAHRTTGSRFAFGSARTSWGAAWFQTDLFINHERSALTVADFDAPADTATTLEPRLGASIQLGKGVLRSAFQRWTRPLAATSTLGPVATAGVPLEDNLVQPGGSQRRGRVQLEWEWSSKMFTSAFADYQRVTNLTERNGLDNALGKQFAAMAQGSDLTPYFAKALTQLRDVGRDVSRLNVNAQNVLEGDPDVADATVSAVGLVLNRLLTDMISIQTQYRYTDAADRGRELLFVPAHALSVGGTYVSPRRVYVSVLALHRSARPVPLAPGFRTLRPADWTARLASSWESRDKRWVVDFAATDLLAKRTPASYTLTAKLRR